ncbi:protein lin-41-like [Saccostrea cucullata]|uniref:protein lin-41-like n=1 Tax=Saccostrea cuccullata TaxID=36930 RepID=UPI002ED0445B
MYNTNTNRGKVTRYNDGGKHIQTIQHSNTGLELYGMPIFITDNNNEDVIVSDSLRGVVVTNRGGIHRFSYTGPSSGVRFLPYGICTDALAHILVCDLYSNTVHMIDKEGNFLSKILTKQNGISRPRSLSYDFKTHLLWVGSWDDNVVRIYRYIKRQDLPILNCN